MSELLPIDIESFERLVYARRYEDALVVLYQTLTRVKQGSPLLFYNPANPTIEALFTRIASATTSMIADPTFQFSPEGFMRLVSDHATFHAIFRGSVYKSADHLLGIIATRNPENANALQFTDQNMLKLLAAWGLDSDLSIDFDSMSEKMPEIVAAALIGMIGVGGIHTEKAYERKIELMRKWPLVERAPLHELMLIAAGDCYMHCSYVDFEEKHDIKQALNRGMRSLVDGSLEGRGLLAIERRELAPKERPTVCVPVEWFGSSHAMYRCYAPSVRQLRKRFRVVAVTPAGQIDDTGKAEFDECRLLPDGPGLSLGDMLAAIAAEKPDIIWYPSIGMAAWWVALSNFRLAPIQIMSPGHPASSYSKEIDAIVSDGDLFGDERHYAEKCVSMPVGGARYIGREGIDYSKIVKPTDGVVRLAVAAMVMKLTPPFLRVVKQIREQSRRAVEIHFFPNQQSSGHYFVERELKAWIPDCVVHPRNEYQPYLEALGRCDFMLSTFPFGGTNSVIDAFLCDVPVLTLEGDQIHSRSDASMTRRMKLPKWLIANTIEEYVTTALRLIEEGPQVVIEREAVEREFFGDGPPEVSDSFVNAVWNIHQERINGSAVNTGGVGERDGTIIPIEGYASGPVGLGIVAGGDDGDRRSLREVG